MQDVDAELIEHMSNPKNYGTLENPDAMGIGINPNNDEKVIIQIIVASGDDRYIIEDIKYQVIGCMTTVVAGSVVTSEVLGQSFDAAREMISATLGLLETISSEEAACSEMVALSLQAALDTYESKQEDENFGTITYTIANNCAPNKEKA